jgi:PAS domain S-box-containing protein
LRAEAGPLLPIVMVTGMDDVASVESAYLNGATDFIAKPVNWALIGHRVRYLLRGYTAMRDLRAAEARNAAILNAIPDLLFEVDIDGRYTDYRAPNPALLAAPAEDLVGKTIAEVLPPVAADVCMSALRTALECGSSSGAQFELILPKGHVWFELSVSRKAVGDGEKPRFIILSRDITERKVAEARIARLAYSDSLTGLPNRHSFLERVDRQIGRARKREQALALLFVDLDGFKDVNDSMGHAVGDLLLQRAADRLREGLRPSDFLARPKDTVGDSDDGEVELARLGGDEFTALLLDIKRPMDAVAAARRLGQLMRRPFRVDGREITLTASIGIAIYPDDGNDAATLLKHADTAMYLAKRSGRDNAQLYSASLTDEILRRIELDTSLRTALERQEFYLVYQPLIDVVSGRVHALEALIRWTHPTRGLVAPLEFIPLAEENGLIGRIGQWVLRTACAEAARWNRAGQPGVKVAINLSPRQFTDPGLAHTVIDALAQTGLPPALLELEITEGVLMESSSAAREALEAMRAHGVHIALDDFGTGYSSLAYLTRMPISNIKVDRSFVTGLLDGGESQAIVRAILAMAGGLGMRVTAEGVETLEQAQALKAMACDYLQGFYFSRPVAPDRIPALLAHRWTTGRTTEPSYAR